jgi:hypothetical protein
LEKEEISLGQAADISSIGNEEMQESVLKVTKWRRLKPAETKKVADFAQSHGERMKEVLKNEPEHVVAIAEGKEVLATKEDANIFFRSKKEEEYMVPCSCPQCLNKFKTRVTINWEKGELKFA